MSKAKSRKDISPGKKPAPLTKKERKERKRKRKEKHVLRWMHADTVLLSTIIQQSMFSTPFYIHPIRVGFLKKKMLWN